MARRTKPDGPPAFYFRVVFTISAARVLLSFLIGLRRQ
jgi:hypothetical protein